MTRVTIRPFEARDLAPAAELLAARHRRDRARLPALHPDFEGAAAAETALTALAENERATGVVALRGTELAGFAFGERSQPAPPDSYMGLIAPARSITIPFLGHAVAVGEDATDLYRRLYRELSDDWVGSGYFRHSVHVAAGDLETQEAWLNLGFGRHVSVAVRPTTGPVEGRKSAGIEIHEAGQEDVAVVADLARTLGLHHIGAPMFMYWPVQPEHEPLARSFLGGLLDAPGDNPHFVAYEQGRPVGMTSFIRGGFVPPYVDGEKNVYLFMGIVDPDAQDGGVGRALLDHGMAWARGEGFERCTLHVLSANHSGAPFWFGNGFEPVEHGMERHIDERVAWALGSRS